MRSVQIMLIVSLLALTALLTSLDAASSMTRLTQTASFVALVVFGVSLVGGFLRARRAVPPRSQIAEIERLYFRAMREMLTDTPNYSEVVNDLQRILLIDPHYKNARHYLNRAMILRREVDPQANGVRAHSRSDFNKLQDKLIDLDPAVRKSVVMELIQYGEMAVDPLIALLMDQDGDVRVHAATALGWVGGPDAVQPLLVALQDENYAVRRYAARALCWVVDETAVPGLINALNDPDSYVVCYAARALGWSHDTRAIQPLFTLLERENADVVEYAVTALEDLGEGDNVKIYRSRMLAKAQ